MRTFFIFAALVAVGASFAILKNQPEKLNVAECLMCELAVSVADPSLEKDAETIEKDFDKECKSILKGPFLDESCEKYVNEHLDDVIKELESGTAPQDVCTNLHACESQ